MSTGLECCFVEREEGKWYYILENWSSPKGAWDWLDYATAYGPFSSEDQAELHLDRNHANPGGWWTIKFDHYDAFSERQRRKYESLMDSADG